MKIFLFYLTLTFYFSVNSFSINYYLSSSIGNDSYTSLQAQNPSTPWKTINKLNSSMNLINPGDSILFKRGDKFIGQIILTRSGTANSNIVFGAYGQGYAPVITGTLPITLWTNYNGNIWVADCPQLDTIVTNIFINGNSQQTGRYPNADEPNGGYLNIESHTGQTTIVSSSLSSSPDFTGGEAVVRTDHWILDYIAIQTHQGHTLYLEEGTTYEIKDNFGFFIQNHLSTLDKAGEWYYDSNNKRIYLFCINDPNNIRTEATAFSTIFETNNQRFFSIENIEFKGSNSSNIRCINSNNFKIKNNIIADGGNDAVIIRGSYNISLINNKIINTNGNAIIILGGRNITLNNNEIKYVGLFAGMGLNSNNQYTAILLDGDNILCESNIIDSVGYSGIFFLGDTILIKNNFINYFCMTLDDGGGIHTWNGEKALHKNRRIESNIILNGVGAENGTDLQNFSLAEGIFLDNGSDHVTVIANTVANCAGYGIFNNFSNSNFLIANTLFNNSVQIVFRDAEHANYSPIYNYIVQNNIFYSKSDSQTIIRSIANSKNDIARYGSFDNNYYCRPLNDNQTIEVTYIDTSIKSYVSERIDLKLWQKDFNYDFNSHISPLKIPVYKLISYTGSNKYSNSSFENNINGWTCWSKYKNADISWDINSNLDEGCLKLRFKEESYKSDSYLVGVCSVGEIVAGEKYILKFSMISTHPEKRVRVFMRYGSSPYKNIAAEQFFIVTKNRKEYELLFLPTSNDSIARIDFEIDEDNESYWIDNVELYKANIQLMNTEDSILFVYNPGNSVLTINDGNHYIDSRGYKFQNFELQPFTSLILLKDTSEDETGQIKISSIYVYSENGENKISTKSGQLQLKADILPFDANNRTFTWSLQNDTGLATINATGLVTAINNGTVTAKAMANDGSGVYGQLVITISNQIIPVTNITVTGAGDKTTITTDNGSLQLDAAVAPSNATNKKVSWSIQNGTGQASINSTGLVTAVANGNVTAYAMANDGSGVFGELLINLSNQFVPVENLTIKSTKGTIIDEPSGTLQLTAEIIPDYATIKEVLWSIIGGNGQISLSPTGLVTAYADGMVNIKAVSKENINISDTINIQITNQSANLLVFDNNPEYIISYHSSILGIHMSYLDRSYQYISLYNILGVPLAKHKIGLDVLEYNFENISPGIFIIEFTGINERSIAKIFVY